MKIMVSIVASALMGVSAVAGAPEATLDLDAPSMLDASAAALASPEVVAIRPVVEALRSGDAVYVARAGLSGADYVPLRPPL